MHVKMNTDVEKIPWFIFHAHHRSFVSKPTNIIRYINDNYLLTFTSLGQYTQNLVRLQKLIIDI